MHIENLWVNIGWTNGYLFRLQVLLSDLATEANLLNNWNHGFDLLRMFKRRTLWSVNRVQSLRAFNRIVSGTLHFRVVSSILKIGVVLSWHIVLRTMSPLRIGRWWSHHFCDVEREECVGASFCFCIPSWDGKAQRRTSDLGLDMFKVQLLDLVFQRFYFDLGIRFFFLFLMSNSLLFNFEFS